MKRGINVKLTPRLKKIALLVRKGKRVCDIGTDHAYLPVYLVENKISPSCVAADIAKGPLKSACKTVEGCNLSDKITCVLSDGFDSIYPDSFDDCVIAGMGGELIADIISRAEFLKDNNRKLILQPMSSIYELRYYLYHNDFTIEDAHIVIEGNRLYYIAEVFYGKQKEPFNEHFCPCLLKHMGINEQKYLNLQLDKTRKIVLGLEKTKNSDELDFMYQRLSYLTDIKNKLEGKIQ